MKRKFLVLLTSGFSIIMMASMDSDSSGPVVLSSGAPIGSTNAPGEQTCGKAGCHTGNNNINTGKGVLSITSQQDISNYKPGETYDIVVALDETGVERFGFSLTALDENNNKAGTLIVTDEARTQIFQGSQGFADREYMTYRMVGTNPYQQGKGQWSFRWKAPDYTVGKIVFYAAGISANNDATDKGDLVYTQTTASGAGLSVKSIPEEKLTFMVYPNPVKDYIRLQLSKTSSEPLSFALYDLTGKKVSSLTERTISSNGKTITFPINAFEPGIYQLSIHSSSVTETIKVVLTN